MTIENLKEAFKFVFKKDTDSAYFKPEHFSQIGENLKSFNTASNSCVLSHGVYLLISRNDEQQYGFWSFSQHKPKYFDKRQLNRNKEQSWMKFALNSYVQIMNQGVDFFCGFDILVWGNLSDTQYAGQHIEALTAFALIEQLAINNTLDQTELQSESEPKYRLVITNTHTPHLVDKSPLAKLLKQNSNALEKYIELENQLIEQAKTAIEKRDTIELGKLINRNHKLLCDELPSIIPPEIEIMKTEAEKSDDVLGFRMAGCGFGGNTITLIKESAIHNYVEQMSEIYEFETDVQNSFFTAQIGDDIFKHYEFE
jgi:galactokinase